MLHKAGSRIRGRLTLAREEIAPMEQTLSRIGGGCITSYPDGVPCAGGEPPDSMILERRLIMPEDDVGLLSFEDALAELDQIVRGLEGGTLKLDAAVQAFERGVKLRRHCEAKLAEVEARVEALVQRSDGSFGTRPLE